MYQFVAAARGLWNRRQAVSGRASATSRANEQTATEGGRSVPREWFTNIRLLFRHARTPCLQAVPHFRN